MQKNHVLNKTDIVYTISSNPNPNPNPKPIPQSAAVP